MSIQRILTSLLGKKLFALSDDEKPRSVFVSADVWAAVLPPFPDTMEGLRRGEFRAWLENFEDGDEFSVSEDPDDKPSWTMLARVKPTEEDFWSMRITTPDTSPGMRAIGAFIGYNEFVVLDWHYREEMDFDNDVNEAIARWRDLFGECHPHTGETLNEHLSNFWPV